MLLPDLDNVRSRRSFLLKAVSGLALTACSSGTSEPRASYAPRLTARPREVATTLSTGLLRQQVDGCDVVAYLPPRADPAAPVPLMVFLHGALRTVETFMTNFRPIADATGVMVLMPYATLDTWDAVYGAFDKDVPAIDSVLAWIFERVRVAPARVALSGFSDGASYALGVGRANGALFSRVIGYSPGFLLDVPPEGKPSIAISHGRSDAVLSFTQTEQRIVPALRQMGYAVDFTAFDGPHAVPLSVATSEMQRLAR